MTIESIPEDQTAMSPKEEQQMVQKTAGIKSWSSPLIEVRVIDPSSSFRGVIALSDIASGEVLSSFSGPVLQQPNRYTIQIGLNEHVECGLDNTPTYLNHMCDPNVDIDVQEMVVRARRDIRAGEQLGFSYVTTELDMKETFDCRCGSEHCMGAVRGFKHMTPQERSQLMARLKVSPTLVQWLLLQSQTTAAAANASGAE